MDNLQLAFEVVFPLFFMMLTGYVVRKVKWVDESGLNMMNRLAFRLFLPMLIFMNIYQSDIENVMNRETLMLILTVWGCVLLTILTSMFLMKKKGFALPLRTVMTQGIYRGNLVLFGIPVAMTLGGAEAVTVTAVLIATVIPLFNFAAVILLERARNSTANVKKMVLQILKNPLIIASVTGLLVSKCGVNLPQCLESPLQSFGNVATPLAFVILGASLKMGDFKTNKNILCVVALGKLVLVPAFAMGLAWGMGLKQEAVIAIIGALASPTAVSSFSMAKEMDVESDVAGQIVAFTSVMSIVTIFVWVTLLGTGGMI